MSLIWRLRTAAAAWCHRLSLKWNTSILLQILKKEGPTLWWCRGPKGVRSWPIGCRAVHIVSQFEEVRLCLAQSCIPTQQIKESSPPPNISCTAGPHISFQYFVEVFSDMCMIYYSHLLEALCHTEYSLLFICTLNKNMSPLRKYTKSVCGKVITFKNTQTQK